MSRHLRWKQAVADGVNGYLFHSADSANDIEINIVLADATNVSQFGYSDFRLTARAKPV